MFVKGEVKLVLFDDRKIVSLKMFIKRLYFRPQITLVTIPPNIWNGFKGLDQVVHIANCLTMPHNEKEMVRKILLIKISTILRMTKKI